MDHRMTLAGKSHGEFAAGAGTIAVGFHLAAMKFDDLADERQTDAQSTCRSFESLAVLHKKLEDFAQHAWGNSASPVLDLQNHVVTNARSGQLNWTARRRVP